MKIAQTSPARRRRLGMSGEARSIGPSNWTSVKLSILDARSVVDKEGDRSIMEPLRRVCIHLRSEGARALAEQESNVR